MLRPYVPMAPLLAWAGRCGILHTDHLGSASLTTDASGNKVGKLRYKPYGETRYIWGVTRTDRRYTGQREEAGLGLYDYGARYYDPLLGRFVSADTIVPQPGNPQSLNRFSYVLGNPLRYTDPTGYFERDEIKRILINHKVLSEGGTAEDWEKWAEEVVSEWEKDAQWWELLEKAQVGDIFDAADFTSSFTSSSVPDRWIGMFVKGRDGNIYFRYRMLKADLLGRSPYWEYGADQLIETLPGRGLQEFYGSGRRTDIILVRQGESGSYTALAATGIYYMPHLGYDTPRIDRPEPDIWGDWTLGCLEVALGAYSGIGLPWGIMKGGPKIHNYLYEKGSLGRLSAYGY